MKFSNFKGLCEGVVSVRRISGPGVAFRAYSFKILDPDLQFRSQGIPGLRDLAVMDLELFRFKTSDSGTSADLSASKTGCRESSTCPRGTILGFPIAGNCSSFGDGGAYLIGSIFRILYPNPKKELLWSLWA